MGKTNNKRYGDFDLWFGVIAAILLYSAILLFIGAFDAPIDELGINKDLLTRNYVLKYYPEFENCSIEYAEKLEDCSSSKCPYYNGAAIYCSEEYDRRDGLRIGGKTEMTDQIEFEYMTLERILKQKLRETCN